MSDKLAKATVIDGIAATEDRDSQNEILMLDGADIADMTKRGYFNDNHGSGFVNTLGRITGAKKIFKEADATDDRQKAYWKQVKRPFLYVKGYLFDEEDHPNAKAVAAIMREFHKMGTPLDVQMSVEGKVKDRDRLDPTILKESAIRNVALTLVPANSNTGSQIIDQVKKTVFTKCNEFGASQEFANSLMKSMETGTVQPNRWIDESPSWDRLEKKVKKLNGMVKMLGAGYGASGAPSGRVDGAALSEESADKKPKATTYEEDPARKKRKEVLKSLIKKVKENYPDLSYEQVVELSLDIFTKKMKGESNVKEI